MGRLLARDNTNRTEMTSELLKPLKHIYDVNIMTSNDLQTAFNYVSKRTQTVRLQNVSLWFSYGQNILSRLIIGDFNKTTRECSPKVFQRYKH